jgi:DNA-binding transcriptional MocR family regulator
MPTPRDNKTRPSPLPTIPAEAALSFLKDTKGALAWTARDLADTLKISRREAEQALAFLQAQGYVQPTGQGGPARGDQRWITTPAGETVCGAKPPRFTPESVQQALTALKDRIQHNNKNLQAPFRVTGAVAFGDFILPDRARVQSADVGIRLGRREDSQRKNTSAVEPRSASDAKAERNFLRDLRAKSTHLTLRPYSDWMRQRIHQDLL